MVQKIKLIDVPTGCTEPYEHGYVKETVGRNAKIAENLNELIDEFIILKKQVYNLTNMQEHKKEIEEEIKKILAKGRYGVKPNEVEYEARKIMYGSFVYEEARENVLKRHEFEEPKEQIPTSGNV